MTAYDELRDHIAVATTINPGAPYVVVSVSPVTLLFVFPAVNVAVGVSVYEPGTK